MENVLEGRLTNLANVCRQKFNTKDTLTLDKMIDLIQNSGGEEVVKTITKQDLNTVNATGSYILENVSGSTNLPNDPDTNLTITGGATIRVIASDDHTHVSQELIELAKGYKYVRSTDDGNNWTDWSVLTPFS